MTLTINQLPPEILSEIFVRCLPSSTQGDNPVLRHIPQLLASVCKLWHSITHALPALWASLHIRCNSYSMYPSIAAINAHLQRSSAHPIAFSLNARSCKYFRRNTTYSLPNILATLDVARERWQSVLITLSSAPQATIDAITEGPAPLLKIFHCELVDPEELQPASIPLHTLQPCSQLESLAWVGFRNTPIHHQLGDSAWPHLTFLRLEASLSVTDCLALLRLSPRLSTAELAAIVLPPRSSHALLHLSHRPLHTLRAEGSHTTTLLSALTLPALTHLQLDAIPLTHTLRTGTRTGLYAFLARSAPPLRTLMLDNI
ncbi:hypothetical protein BD779DRAFT_1678566 [Infundibulicybe gibba]|nr:hypothetical protein BD779DRAFT_1678566 [Infundibulicybe gibba]